MLNCILKYFNIIDAILYYSRYKKSVFISNSYGATNTNILRQNNIKFIFNVSPYNFCYPSHSLDLIIKQFKVLDNSDISTQLRMLNNFDKLVGSIRDAITSPIEGNILVHCQMGVQRSPTVLAAFLMKYHHLTAKQAIKLIRNYRWIAYFWHNNFETALKWYENKLKLDKAD